MTLAEPQPARLAFPAPPFEAPSTRWPARVGILGAAGLIGSGVLPARLSPRGLADVEDRALAPEEAAALRRAAESVRATATAVLSDGTVVA